MDAGLSTWEDEGGAIPTHEGGPQESDAPTDKPSAPESNSTPENTARPRAVKGKS
jgi:hypothetical protein